MDALTYEIPEHVVFREFIEETVMLNLQSGLYHGLNPTAGRMLQLLVEPNSPEIVATTISEDVDADAAEVLGDVLALRDDLVARGLLVPTTAEGVHSTVSGS